MSFTWVMLSVISCFQIFCQPRDFGLYTWPQHGQVFGRKRPTIRSNISDQLTRKLARNIRVKDIGVFPVRIGVISNPIIVSSEIFIKFWPEFVIFRVNFSAGIAKRRLYIMYLHKICKKVRISRASMQRRPPKAKTKRLSNSFIRFAR